MIPVLGVIALVLGAVTMAVCAVAGVLLAVSAAAGRARRRRAFRAAVRDLDAEWEKLTGGGR